MLSRQVISRASCSYSSTAAAAAAAAASGATAGRAGGGGSAGPNGVSRRSFSSKVPSQLYQEHTDPIMAGLDKPRILITGALGQLGHSLAGTLRHHSLRVFVPSTIGAFGRESPKVNTPDVTIQRPKTIYGVSKVHAELLGEYMNEKFGLDFRSLRFPGVISATQPGGGTTDYAVQIFYDALEKGEHECYLEPDTRLPMMYIDDCLRSVVEMLETNDASLRYRTYNVAAMSFTPDEIAAAIRKVMPNFKITYNVCPIRQAIANSWPQSLDDKGAQTDWGWKARYDLDRTVETMFDKLGNGARQQQTASIPQIAYVST